MLEDGRSECQAAPNRILAALFDESQWLDLFYEIPTTGTEICDYALGIGLIRGDEMHTEIADAITRLCDQWDRWSELSQALGGFPASG